MGKEQKGFLIQYYFGQLNDKGYILVKGERKWLFSILQT